MELYEAMRTNPSCRYFTDDPVDPAVLHRIFDHARFASSGGNRQGWRTIVVTEPELKPAPEGVQLQVQLLVQLQARDEPEPEPELE